MVSIFYHEGSAFWPPRVMSCVHGESNYIWFVAFKEREGLPQTKLLVDHKPSMALS